MIRKVLPLNWRGRAIILSVISAFCYVANSAAFELEPVSYEQAVKIYRDNGGVENYRCTLLPADEQYYVAGNTQPVAVEIDELLFIKLQGKIYQLPQRQISGVRTDYALEELSATLIIAKQFNQSEYGESDDRHVELTVENATQKRVYSTFGTACGL
ncbi:hypothetical protein QE250_03740 [Chromatiaceae bacterium AAb-1]|nr:hypothetical protein [Chromatiaceae bacterium AAb-1]